MNMVKIVNKSKTHWKHGKHKGGSTIAMHLDRLKRSKPKPIMYGSVAELVAKAK